MDHHIKCGNSLIGVLNIGALTEGVPDEAFNALTGDDKKVASALKKRNREERKGQPSLPFDAAEHVHQYSVESEQFVAIAEDTPADVRRKKEAYETTRQEPNWWHDWVAANLWTGAFFLPLTKYDDPAVPTHDKFIQFLRGGHVDGQLEGAALGLAAELKFFHWPLEFPEVFERGGFDVVMGNPPWDKITLKEEEHWADDPHISGALNKAERARRIAEYRASDKPLRRARVASFDDARHHHEAISKFVRASKRFPLTAIGDVNTYALFAELARTVIGKRGRVGIIVQTGIAVDDTCKQYFCDLMDRGSLVSLFDFVNLEGFFPGIHRTHPHFCALTLTGSPNKEPVEFAFFLTRTDQLKDPLRRFILSRDDLALLNPNTRTCSIFRTRADAALTTKIYRRVPVLVDEGKGKNPWSVEFDAMFHMANDSDLFETEDTPGYVRLYESKLFHQFDHRWATYEGEDTRDCTNSEKADPSFLVNPRYWVPIADVRARMSVHRDWIVGFRRLTNTTNARTCIFTVLPFSGVGDNCFVFNGWKHSPPATACFVGNSNSLVFDYVVRQKMGGTNLSFYVVRQLPFLAPDAYYADDVDYVWQRVLQLVHTAVDLQAFANDGGSSQSCFGWEPDQRAKLRAELDGYYAHLYGLTRDELQYILDPKDVFGPDFPSETFRVLKEREESEYGEYRTRRLVLEAFDKLSDSPRFRDEMSKRESAIGASKGHPMVPTR